MLPPRLALAAACGRDRPPRTPTLWRPPPALRRSPAPSLSFSGTAAEASPQREAHTDTPVRPSPGLSRLATPPGGSSLPSAASRREQEAAGSGRIREISTARPHRRSLPVALPVSDAPGSEAAATAPGQLFFFFFSFLMLEAEEDFNFSTGLTGILLAGEGRGGELPSGQVESYRERRVPSHLGGEWEQSARLLLILGLSGARLLFCTERAGCMDPRRYECLISAFGAD